MDFKALTSQVIEIAQAAGIEILKIYDDDSISVEYKEDNSPLTQADKNAHNTIVKGLSEVSDLPILSEEAADIAWSERNTWTSYWLVDPLDGTKEFVKRNGEFTVNIALIENGEPVLGVVYAPKLETLYYGAKGIGAQKVDSAGKTTDIEVSQNPDADSCWRVVGSRSHQSEEFKEFVKCFKSADIVSLGSSLKLCMVAEGAADIYPRLGLTSEWDTAAAQAVVEAAGGQVINWETKEPLRYNTKESLLNPYFIVCPEKSSVWLS